MSLFEIKIGGRSTPMWAFPTWAPPICPGLDDRYPEQSDWSGDLQAPVVTFDLWWMVQEQLGNQTEETE